MILQRIRTSLADDDHFTEEVVGWSLKSCVSGVYILERGERWTSGTRQELEAKGFEFPELEPPKPFAEGDIVMLKSGGPKMTIATLSGECVDVVYVTDYGTDVIQTARLLVNVLTRPK